MGWRRSLATLSVAATLATAVATPSHGAGRPFRPADTAARGAAEDIGIGLGITTGVVALVGGALWYYFHTRHATSAQASVDKQPLADVLPTTN